MEHIAETSEEIQSENIDSSVSTGKPVAKAKPKPKSVVNSNVNVFFKVIQVGTRTRSVQSR